MNKLNPFRWLKIPMIKNILINSSGNYLNVFFSLTYALILVRVFTPAQYGILSVLLAITYVLTNVLDFGISATIYSYLPPLIEQKKLAYNFLKTNLVFQNILAITALLILFIFIKPFDRYILKLNAPLIYYLITFISIPLYIGQNFCINSLIAVKKFLPVNIINNLVNFIRMLLLILLVLTNRINLVLVLIILGWVGPILFFGFIYFYFRHSINEIISAKIERVSFKKSYTLTFFVSSQVFNLASRIDLFVISYYLTRPEVGYYGLSTRIIIAILTTITSFTQVFSPEFAKAKDKQVIMRLVKQTTLAMFIPIAIFIAVILTPTQIYQLVFTRQFTQVSAVTKGLAFAYIFYSLGAGLGLFTLYTLRKPVHILVANLILLLVIASGSLILVPRYRLFGPAIAIFIAYFLAFVYLWAVYKKGIESYK